MSATRNTGPRPGRQEEPVEPGLLTTRTLVIAAVALAVGLLAGCAAGIATGLEVMKAAGVGWAIIAGFLVGLATTITTGLGVAVGLHAIVRKTSLSFSACQPGADGLARVSEGQRLPGSGGTGPSAGEGAPR
jgi:hypothetical protein